MTALALYRDDGLLSRALGSALAAIARVPASVLMLLGALPLLALIAIEGDGASDAAAGAAIAWAVVLGGISSGRPLQGRFEWAVAPLLRVTEYAGLLWIGSLAGDDSLPAAFALICAIAYRHYDDVYRLRTQGTPPARWVAALGGGWDGRLVIAYVLLVAGALPAGFYVLAAVLGIAFAGESIVSWLRFSASARPILDEDEEEDEDA